MQESSGNLCSCGCATDLFPEFQVSLWNVHKSLFDKGSIPDLGVLWVKVEHRAGPGWDGLKGYLTNTDLPAGDVIENHGQLWQFELTYRLPNDPDDRRRLLTMDPRTEETL